MEITNETKVTVGLLIATVLIIISGAWLAGRGGSDEGKMVPAAAQDRLVRGDSIVKGPQDAAVTVVEFADFQCPACGALHPAMQQVMQENAARSVRFVFRHFPLSQHEHAQEAAEASQAAEAQGKFWEYYDLLFTNQNDLTRDGLERYAEQLDLDMDMFRAALDEGTYKEVVQQDASDGRALGVRGTPTVYINGQQYTGGFVVGDLQAVIDAALQQ